MRYRLDDLRLEDGHRAVLTSTLLREDDNRPLAQIETVKALRGPSVFGRLWGDTVTPAPRRPRRTRRPRPTTWTRSCCSCWNGR